MINVYLTYRFSNYLRSLRKAEKMSLTIQNQAILLLLKLKIMWRMSQELFEEIANLQFEQFLVLPTSTKWRCKSSHPSRINK
ncbi:hypothetical protein C0J52_26744 [Blattella germanica]|nr:hypothetical protein C0J52_26744 [Blattella germanica]